MPVLLTSIISASGWRNSIQGKGNWSCEVFRMRHACCGGCVLERSRKEANLPSLKTLAGEHF